VVRRSSKVQNLVSWVRIALSSPDGAVPEGRTWWLLVDLSTNRIYLRSPPNPDLNPDPDQHTIDIVSGVDDVAPKSAGESISKVMGFSGAIRGLTYNISLLARFHDRKINLNTYEAISSRWPPTL